ncbi:hypothetical protein A2U01_0091536, partial [Trifolium medium]|nr:hypothetical protein [Trifolium medium]
MARLDRTSIERVMSILVGGHVLGLPPAPGAVPYAPSLGKNLEGTFWRCHLRPAQLLPSP